MLWIILTLTAAILWAIMNIIDKHVITDELKDPIVTTMISTLMAGAIFLLFGLLTGLQQISLLTKVLALVGGLLNGAALYFYYRALSRGEVSRVSPIISVRVIIVMIAAFFIFGEVLTLNNYLGAALILIGVSLVSIKFSKKKISVGIALLLMLIATAGFASRDILFKVATQGSSLLTILLWVGIGNLIFSSSMFLFHHPYIRKRWASGVKHVFLSGSFGGIGLLCFISAISLASVSLVNALVSIYTMFVFIIATTLSHFNSKIIREKLDSKTITMKTAGIILTIVGAIIVALL